MRRFVEIALFTERVGRVGAFHARALGAAPEAEWPGGMVFATDGLTLLIHERGPGPAQGPPNEDHVAVGVHDLDAVCARLVEEGLALLVEPRDYPWGRSTYVRDPDGRLVELSQAA